MILKVRNISYLSPYMTEHLKRFSEFVLDLINLSAIIDDIRLREVF